MKLSDVLQMPEKQWTQKGNGVQTTIMAVEPYQNDKFGYKQVVTVKDLTGDQARITLQTKFPDALLNESHIGKQGTWRLRYWYNRQQQRKMITGYPEAKIDGEGTMTDQPQPALPYNAPQTPSQPLQTTNSEPDWDAIAEGKVRCNVACAFIQAGKEDVPIKAVEFWVRYIMDGRTVPPDHNNMDAEGQPF